MANQQYNNGGKYLIKYELINYCEFDKYAEKAL